MVYQKDLFPKKITDGLMVIGPWNLALHSKLDCAYKFVAIVDAKGSTHAYKPTDKKAK